MSHHDRGSKKWSMQIMMPEHEEALKQLFDEQEKQPEPQLSEEQLAEHEETILLAFHEQHIVTVNYYERGYFYTVTGVIMELQHTNQTVVIEDVNTDERIRITFQYIISIN